MPLIQRLDLPSVAQHVVRRGNDGQAYFIPRSRLPQAPAEPARRVAGARLPGEWRARTAASLLGNAPPDPCPTTNWPPFDCTQTDNVWQGPTAPTARLSRRCGAGCESASPGNDQTRSANWYSDPCFRSQGTLTVANAARYYGLPRGSSFEMRSPALSYFSARSAVGMNGGTLQYIQPWGDIANIYAPTINPLKWMSGFRDVMCGACTHTANGLP